MYEYSRRSGFGALAADPFNWRSQSCSGGNGVMLGAGEVACVPANERNRAASRGCVSTEVGDTSQCSGGGLFFCCPERSKVRELQQAIISAGCSLPQYGADGLWGSETVRGVQCLVGQDGWQAILSRYQVVQGLIDPPENGGASPSLLTGSTRLVRSEPIGEGTGFLGYVGVGAAALVLGFAISQMMKKDESKDNQELEEEKLVFGRPRMSGAY